MKIRDVNGTNNFEDKPIKPGQVIKTDQGVLWRDMPRLGWDIRDWWNGPRGLHDSLAGEHEIRDFRPDAPVNPERYAVACQQWFNLNKWMATTVSHHYSVSVPVAQYDLFGVITIVGALEYPLDGPYEAIVELPAACTWLTIAGLQLRCSIDEEGLQTDAGPLWTSSILYDGGEGRSTTQRWQFWRQRLRDIAEDGSVPEDLRQLAAGTAMYLRELDEA